MQSHCTSLLFWLMVRDKSRSCAHMACNFCHSKKRQLFSYDQVKIARGSLRSCAGCTSSGVRTFIFKEKHLDYPPLCLWQMFDGFVWEARVSEIIREGQDGDIKKKDKQWDTGGQEEECRWEAEEGGKGWGERGGEGADRQAGGAIIAGFMYELLIESVVTSWVVNSGSGSDRESNSLTREGRGGWMGGDKERDRESVMRMRREREVHFLG